MIRKLACALALLVFVASAANAADCSDMLAATGAPRYRSDPDEHVELCREGYILSHNNVRKGPDWVLEKLTPNRFVGPADRKREKDPFAADTDLPEGKRAELSDYAGSKFDRGHMAPAADMKYSIKALIESFYLSNMAPQVGEGLNRNIWAYLEEYVRNWACERGELIVITGPVFDDGHPMTIGKNAVAVPSGFYKIAYDPARMRAIAFVLPNQKIEARKKDAAKVLAEYITPISEIELRTGLDFLAKLSKRDQRRIEGSRSVMWPDRLGCERS